MHTKPDFPMMILMMPAQAIAQATQNTLKEDLEQNATSSNSEHFLPLWLEDSRVQK